MKKMMKQFIASLVAATALCGGATAQTLSVADVEALPGETVAFTLTVDVAGGTYSGFQFQMQFPAEGFTTVGTTVSAAWDGASFGVGDLVGGAANGSAFSTSDTAIPDGEQEIGTVRFTVGSGVAVGSYPVTIFGFNFLDGSNYTPVANVTFNVKVVSRHTVVLDETSTTAPTAATDVNVMVRRSIQANQWSTICLPFAMTEAQVKAAFGDDVKLGDFTGYETTNDTNDDIIGITVNFNDVTAIESNHPYIIKVSSTVTEFAVDGVDIDPEEEPTVAAIKRTKKQWSEMIGTYVANTTIKEECLFLSDNKFWYSNGSTKMKAFRAYFDFYDVLASVENAAARISMNFDEKETTGIREMKPIDNNKVIYDLQGRRVANPTKGLYIQNGIKRVIK